MLFLVRDYGALWKSLKSILHSLAVVRGNFCCFTNATIRSNLTGFSTLKSRPQHKNNHLACCVMHFVSTFYFMGREVLAGSYVYTKVKATASGGNDA